MAGPIGRALETAQSERAYGRQTRAMMREVAAERERQRVQEEERQRRHATETRAFVQAEIANPKWAGYRNPEINGQLLAVENAARRTLGLTEIGAFEDTRPQQYLARANELRAAAERNDWITPGFASFLLDQEFGSDYASKVNLEILDQAALGGYAGGGEAGGVLPPVKEDAEAQPKASRAAKEHMMMDSGQAAQAQRPKSVIDTLFEGRGQRFRKREDVETEFMAVTSERSLAHIVATNPGYLHYLIHRGKELGSPMLEVVDVQAVIAKGQQLKAFEDAGFFRDFLRDTQNMTKEARAEYWNALPDEITTGKEMPNPEYLPTPTAMANIQQRAKELLSRDKFAAARESGSWMKYLAERGLGPENADYQVFAGIYADAMGIEGWQMGSVPSQTVTQQKSQASRDESLSIQREREKRLAEAGAGGWSISGQMVHYRWMADRLRQYEKEYNDLESKASVPDGKGGPSSAKQAAIRRRGELEDKMAVLKEQLESFEPQAPGQAQASAGEEQAGGAGKSVTMTIAGKDYTYKPNQCGQFVKDMLAANGVKVPSSLSGLPKVSTSTKQVMEPGYVVHLGPGAGSSTEHWAMVGDDGVSLIEIISSNGQVRYSESRTVDSVRSRIKGVYNPFGKAETKAPAKGQAANKPKGPLTIKAEEDADKIRAKYPKQSMDAIYKFMTEQYTTPDGKKPYKNWDRKQFEEYWKKKK